MKPWLWILILWTLALAALSIFCGPAPAGKLVTVRLTAKDSTNGEVLYHRTAYVSFGPIEEAGVVASDAFSDGVAVHRTTRAGLNACDPGAPIVNETGNTLKDYCNVETAEAK